MRISFFLLSLLFSIITSGQHYTLFTGTYTAKGSGGIYVYRFDAATGNAILLTNTEGLSNPSYLAISKDKKFVYAVNEDGGGRGAVSALSWNKQKNSLNYINSQSSGGDHPCYVALHPSGQWLTVGNYSGGNLSLYKLRSNGAVAPALQTVQHSGSGGDTTRQTAAHVHATVWSTDGKNLVVPDLGMDKLMLYRFSAAAPQPLQPAAPAYMQTAPGAGPRHFTFTKNGKRGYSIEELSGTVVFYEVTGGSVKQLQRISSHPDDYDGAKGAADIHLSPDEKFLYATNRGAANSIAVFAVGPTGKLALKKVQPVMGAHPRNFVIDPTGAWLLVANRDSDAVVVFKRNKTTGWLTDSGKRIKLSMPVCLKFE